MTILLLFALIIYSKFLCPYRQTFDNYDDKEVYSGLIYPFYPGAEIIMKYVITKPFSSSYLRWHRLLYNNKKLDFALNATLAKSMFWLAVTISILLDAFLFKAQFELYFTLAAIGTLLIILPVLKIKRQYQEHCHQIMKELPAFVQQMALLIKSGSNARQSIDTIYRNSSDKEGIHTLLAHVYFENERGNDFFQSFSLLNEFIHHKSIHHLSLLMGQVKRAGVHQFSTQLIELAELMMTERQTYIRIIAEQLSTKLLAPMMISMVTILTLLIYPIMTQLN